MAQIKIIRPSFKAIICSWNEACLYSKQAFSTLFCPLSFVCRCVSLLSVIPPRVNPSVRMKRSTLWHLCSREGNTACCDYPVQYGCTHCNCIPSNALIDTSYITCNFMDILIATNYLCLGLLQYSSFQCNFFFYFSHAFLALAVLMQSCW